jgi:hypothetical protein
MRPLGTWTDPITEDRASSGMFRATWEGTVGLLGAESEVLGAELVVIEVDARRLTSGGSP